MNKISIKNEIMRLLKKRKAKDLASIIQSLQINIFKMDLGKGSKGMYRYERRQRYIILNYNLKEYEVLWVLAHEVGHAVLHTNSSEVMFLCKKGFFNIGNLEIEADRFAAEILLPDEHPLLLEGRSTYDVAMAECLPHRLVKLKYGKDSD